MPIRKEMKHLYPPPNEWKAIRDSVLERANNACECTGECGWEHVDSNKGKVCAAPNRVLVQRNECTRWMMTKWFVHSHNGTCLDEPCDAAGIVLTIAHLDHDPTNNDPSNLRAMCQRCHLRYDSKEHQKNAAETRRKNTEKLTGQKRLF